MTICFLIMRPMVHRPPCREPNAIAPASKRRCGGCVYVVYTTLWPASASGGGYGRCTGSTPPLPREALAALNEAGVALVIDVGADLRGEGDRVQDGAVDGEDRADALAATQAVADTVAGRLVLRDLCIGHADEPLSCHSAIRIGRRHPRRRRIERVRADEPTVQLRVRIGGADHIETDDPSN